MFTKTSVYPQGAIVTGPDRRNIFFIEGGGLRHVTSPEMLSTFHLNLERLVVLPSRVLDSLPKGDPIDENSVRVGKAPAGTLLEAGGNVYLVDQKVLRYITTGDIFEQLGFQWNRILLNQNIQNYSFGDPIFSVLVDNLPDGLLLHTSDHIYYTENRELHHVIDSETLAYWHLDQRPAIMVTDDELSRYRHGEDIDAWPTFEAFDVEAGIGRFKQELMSISYAGHQLAPYWSLALSAVSTFDFTPDDLAKSRQIMLRRPVRDTIRRVVWFIPPFASGSTGGPNTILRFADYLKRQGLEMIFAVSIPPDPGWIQNMESIIAETFPNLKGSAVYGTGGGLDQLPDADIAFATLWTTAYELLKYNRVGRKYYFMQDYEPLFYPAGSISAMTEATYRMGFFAVANTSSLKTYFERWGGEAYYFTPSVDSQVFYPPTVEKDENRYSVFFYGRPNPERNGFELGAQALKIVKAKLGDRVDIYTAGSHWNPAEFGLEGIVRNLGFLPYRATGVLYRKSHLGLAMMMTPHPSYIPQQLMASGSLVVANKNPGTEWLLKDRKNSLVAETTASCLAEAILEGLLNRPLRENIVHEAIQDVKRSLDRWDDEFAEVWRFIERKYHKTS